MKAKKTARILCALSVAALCLSCVSATAFAGTFNGEDSGIVYLNGYPYQYTSRLHINRSTGGYYSSCNTQAAIVRIHQNIYGKWLTKNYGFVTDFEGPQFSERDKIGVSYSKTVNCPKGLSQVVKYTQADNNITLCGDVSVTSEIHLSAN